MRRFAFRLALKVGETDVNGMLRRMPMRQFLDWMHYANLEPFEETRGDWRAAHIVSTLCNIYRKSGSPAIEIGEALISWSKEDPAPGKREQSWQEQKAIGFMWAHTQEG